MEAAGPWLLWSCGVDEPPALAALPAGSDTLVNSLYIFVSKQRDWSLGASIPREDLEDCPQTLGVLEDELEVFSLPNRRFFLPRAKQDPDLLLRLVLGLILDGLDRLGDGQVRPAA